MVRGTKYETAIASLLCLALLIITACAARSGHAAEAALANGPEIPSGPGTRYSLGTFRDTGVALSDFAARAERFRMPIGNDGQEDLGEDLSMLEIGTWPLTGYPRVGFNVFSPANGWYAATAFNQDRWMDNGWAEPSGTASSVYRSGNHHPGEDWNRIGGGDLGLPVHAVADGIVLLSQEQVCTDDESGQWQPCVFGNMVVVGHLTPDGLIMGSVYAHLEEPSRLAAGDRVGLGEILGMIGASAASSPHLHFELTRPGGELIRVDPVGNIQVPVLETESMRIGWHWPIRDPHYVAAQYENPSLFILNQVGHEGAITLTRSRIEPSSSEDSCVKKFWTLPDLALSPFATEWIAHTR
jgi:murein DD-endopeptidase MepM/ murein hydrolase activator NlpD